MQQIYVQFRLDLEIKLANTDRQTNEILLLYYNDLEASL